MSRCLVLGGGCTCIIRIADRNGTPCVISIISCSCQWGLVLFSVVCMVHRGVCFHFRFQFTLSQRRDILLFLLGCRLLRPAIILRCFHFILVLQRQLYHLRHRLRDLWHKCLFFLHRHFWRGRGDSRWWRVGTCSSDVMHHGGLHHAGPEIGRGSVSGGNFILVAPLGVVS